MDLIDPEGFFILGKEFIDGDQVCLILGDNIFYGKSLPALLRSATDLTSGAKIFGYPVSDPNRYGIVALDENNKALSLEEKPDKPKSNLAVPGIYFYDSKVVEFAESLAPSARGEIEITDLNKIYMDRGELHVEVLGRGIAWLDAGTHGSLLEASNFVRAIQRRQGLMLSCPEEIAYRMDYISEEALRKLANDYAGNEYGDYLLELVDPKFGGNR